MNKDLLLLVEALANEKNVPRDVVFSALESALASATKRRFKEDVDVRVAIDHETGLYEAFRRWTVVEDNDHEEPSRQLAMTDVVEQNMNLNVGDIHEEPIPAEAFGRISAQAAKQVILQKIRDAERDQILNEFLEREDNLFNGVVKKMDRSGALVEQGRVEAFLDRSEMIPKESMRVGDRVRAYVARVERNTKGAPQLLLSRSSKEFLYRLFELEVPEIEEGLIEIMGIARDPGLRAKVAVRSKDKRLDAKGTCIGMRGSRVNAVTNELAGERIDIVLWSENTATYLINALAPAEIVSIFIDEEKHSADVVVKPDNMAAAIGQSGQNVKLASVLTGWTLNLMTPEEAQQKRSEEEQSLRQLFMNRLEVDEEIADILIEEGFLTLEHVAYTPIDEMLAIESLDEEIVKELRERALSALNDDVLALEESIKDVEEALLNLEGMNKSLAAKLAKNGIKTRDDLGDLDIEELNNIVPSMSKRDAQNLIMKAREHWFAEDNQAESASK
ncbi:MAG: transcription termination factor NusA [Burkholderiales bacterium]|jgi:N utilization substance protein A|nr:transcription termination factor NusA [Burkholderiales bacterium]